MWCRGNSLIETKQQQQRQAQKAYIFTHIITWWFTTERSYSISRKNKENFQQIMGQTKPKVHNNHITGPVSIQAVK